MHISLRSQTETLFPLYNKFSSCAIVKNIEGTLRRILYVEEAAVSQVTPLYNLYTYIYTRCYHILYSHIRYITFYRPPKLPPISGSSGIRSHCYKLDRGFWTYFHFLFNHSFNAKLKRLSRIEKYRMPKLVRSYSLTNGPHTTLEILLHNPFSQYRIKKKKKMFMTGLNLPSTITNI